MNDHSTPITEGWLEQAGFKWHQIERQPSKHWLLWLGPAIDDGITTVDDIGVEVAPGFRGDGWFCWFRSDVGGRYSRFIHVRQITATEDLVRLIEAITGQTWDVANNLYGSMHSLRRAARFREHEHRLDRELLVHNPKWSEVEKDDSRGRALPEHMEVHEKGKKS